MLHCVPSCRLELIGVDEQVAMQQSAVDPLTGLIDMNVIQTGMTDMDRASAAALTTELDKLIAGVAYPLPP